MSKALEIKKNILEKGGKTNECPLSLMCNLFTKWNAYEKDQAVFFSSHQHWSHNQVIAFELAILGHVLLPRNLEGVDIRLPILRE